MADTSQTGSSLGRAARDASLADLLAHAGWMRRLARQLVSEAIRLLACERPDGRDA